MTSEQLCEIFNEAAIALEKKSPEDIDYIDLIYRHAKQTQKIVDLVFLTSKTIKPDTSIHILFHSLCFGIEMGIRWQKKFGSKDVS